MHEKARRPAGFFMGICLRFYIPRSLILIL
jgi:hypothetical protein